MQSVRVYIPDLGESTFKAVEIDDKATVADVQEKLIGKLINAGTILEIDATQFKLFGAKNNSKKDKKLDSNKNIAVLAKKWAKNSPNSYKLLFKGISSDIKLPTIQHNSHIPHITAVAPTLPVPNNLPLASSPSNSNSFIQTRIEESITPREQQLPPANDGTQESAMQLLNYFEEEYRNNRIHNTYDIIVALGD